MSHPTLIATLVALAGSAQTHAQLFLPNFELSSLDGTNGFVVNGINTDDGSGRSVSGAGDVNNDGIDDFIIGALAADPNGSFSGQSYVVFGGIGVGAGGAIELSSLNGTNGFVLNGIGLFDQSGISVSGAGDINGDEIDDLVIGAFGGDPNGNYSGESYVVFGSEDVVAGGELELSSLNGADGFVLNGSDTGEQSGISVSGAGDINDDGVDDLIIGARSGGTKGNPSGKSYVVYGGVGIGASGAFELSSLNGTNGFVLNGVDADDQSGFSVSGAGDVNGDGIDDILIGAQYAAPNGTRSGESYVVFGGAEAGAGGVIELSSLDGSNGYVLNGVDAMDRSGFAVSRAGDVNDDNVDDLIIGAFGADPNGNYSGETYVVFGGADVGAGGALELSSLNGDNGFVLNGIDADDQSGRSVSNAGDINGDGIHDLIIGAFGSNTNGGFSGQSYVVFGGSGLGSGGSLELSALSGANGFVLNGVDVLDQSGFSVSDAGDVNGDGVDDLIIGASGADPNTNNCGESYVVFGKASSPPSSADLDGDGCVDSADLAILLAAWGTPAADLDGEGTTSSADLAILLAAWGGCS